MSSSLISNGLKASNFRSVEWSAMAGSSFLDYVDRVVTGSAHWDFSPLGQQNYQHHAPDGQQRVSDCVSDGVAQAGNLALGTVVDHTERGRRGACTGASAQHNGIVESKYVLTHVHRQNQRHGGDDDTPEKQAESQLLESSDKPWTGRDADHRDEHVQADRVHEPDG